MFTLLSDSLISYFVGLTLGLVVWYFFGTLIMKTCTSIINSFKIKEPIKSKVDILREELSTLEEEADKLQSKLNARLEEGYE